MHIALLALVLACAAAPALADDRQTCERATGPAALAACDRAIASGQHAGTDLAKLHTNRGVERKRAGDLAGALADYSEAVRLNPGDPFAYNNRANVRRDMGDLPGAIADYGEALRVDPGYTAGYVNRGMLHERMGALDLARADYREALARPPKYGNGPGGQDIARRRLAALETH
jgi:tetratricopeptide (TPR) repeat protein